MFSTSYITINTSEHSVTFSILKERNVTSLFLLNFRSQKVIHGDGFIRYGFAKLSHDFAWLWNWNLGRFIDRFLFLNLVICLKDVNFMTFCTIKGINRQISMHVSDCITKTKCINNLDVSVHLTFQSMKKYIAWGSRVKMPKNTIMSGRPEGF